MYIPDIELHDATTLEDAAAMKSRYAPGVRLLAGGTDLLVDLKTGRIGVDHVVSLSRISDLRGISMTNDSLRIGALTTITQLGRSPVVRERFPALLDATGKMAAPQVRNVATVGGNIASAVPCADLPPVLTAMNASLVLWSAKGERSVPLESFFLGARETILRDEEIVTAIIVRQPDPGFGAAYARFGLRNGNTIAVAAVAAGLRINADKIVQDARVVLGAVAPIPKLVESAGALLVGKPADQDAFGRAADAATDAADPISDIRGSADYRRELVKVLTMRALKTALARAKEAL